jgi:hypothetical protein
VLESGLILLMEETRMLPVLWSSGGDGSNVYHFRRCKGRYVNGSSEVSWDSRSEDCKPRRGNSSENREFHGLDRLMLYSMGEEKDEVWLR